METRVADSANVDPTASIGDGTSIWHLAQIRENAVLGERCVVGRGAYVGSGVRIGDRVKIQNNALVYEPAVVEQGAFIGPAAILTNDQHPRAVNADGSPKSASDWDPVGVTVREGASIGAGAVCVAPVTVGRWALVAAGAVVTRDVPDHAIVLGNPARQRGWVGTSGRPLTEQADGSWVCPGTSERYRLDDQGALTQATRSDLA